MKPTALLRLLTSLFLLTLLLDLIDPSFGIKKTGEIVWYYPALKTPVVILWLTLLVVNLASFVGMFLMKKWAYWAFGISHLIGNASSLIASSPSNRYSMVTDNFSHMLIGSIMGIAWFSLLRGDDKSGLPMGEPSQNL